MDSECQGQSGQHAEGKVDEMEGAALNVEGGDQSLVSKGDSRHVSADCAEKDEESEEDIDSDALQSDEEDGETESLPSSSYDNKVTSGDGDSKSFGDGMSMPSQALPSVATASVPQHASPRMSGGSRVRRPRVKGEHGGLYPYQQVITEFEEFLRHAKANPLAAKTIQMYRWMTGSVFRKIDAAVPGMSNEELKAYVAKEVDHIVDEHVEWESQGFKHFLEYMNIKKTWVKRKAPPAQKAALSTGLLSQGPSKKVGHCEAVIKEFERYLREDKGLLKGVDNSTRAIGTFLSETLGDDIDGDTSVHELAACIEDNKDYVADMVEEKAAENGQLAMGWKRFVSFMRDKGHNIDIVTNRPYRGFRGGESGAKSEQLKSEYKDSEEGMKRPGSDSALQDDAKRQKLAEQASELAALRSRVAELTRGHEDLMIHLNSKDQLVREKDQRIRELKAEVEERQRRGTRLEQDNHSLRRELHRLEDQMQALPRMSPPPLDPRPLPPAAYPTPSLGTFLPLSSQDPLRSLNLAAEQLRHLGPSPHAYLPRSTMTSTSSSGSVAHMSGLPSYPPAHDAPGLSTLFAISQLRHDHPTGFGKN